MDQITAVERTVALKGARVTAPQSTLSCDIDVPLIVDLDGTLLATDTLVEELVQIAATKPLKLPGLLAGLLRGRAYFKRAVHGAAALDVNYMPIRQGVLDLINTERAAGRDVHLVTAAPQETAVAIAKAFPLFDSVIGTTHGHNLRGREKLSHLQSRFGNRFIYAGDASADTPIFHVALNSILVGKAASRRASLESEGVAVAGVITEANNPFSAWIRLLRVKHWSKNLVVAAPLFLSQQFTDIMSTATVFAAFLAWNLLASGTYILNDLFDLAVDRQHPTKRHRPLAAGEITLLAGSLASAGLITAALLAASFFPPAFATTLGAYFILTSSYSLKLKRIPLIDVNVIGILFTLRVIAGMAVLQMPISLWLVSFSVALFTSFALAKRHAELYRIAADRSNRITGRGYQVEDLSATLAFGIAYALSATLIMLLYFTFEAAGKGIYNSVEWLYIIPAVLLNWLSRIWLLANRGALEDDPVSFALRDPSSWIHGAAFLFFWAMAVWS